MVVKENRDPINLETAVAKAILKPTYEKLPGGSGRLVWDFTKSPYYGLAGAFEDYNETTRAALADAINAIAERLIVIEGDLGIITK